MSNTSHTPGPWKTRAINIEAAGVQYLVKNKGAGYNELRANARLIAASPELLEACKAIQAAYGRTDNGQPVAMAQAVKLVIESIKKAV